MVANTSVKSGFEAGRRRWRIRLWRNAEVQIGYLVGVSRRVRRSRVANHRNGKVLRWDAPKPCPVAGCRARVADLSESPVLLQKKPEAITERTAVAQRARLLHQFKYSG